MANFCKFCGTKLEAGQVCSCPDAQAAAAAPVATAAPEAAAPVATAAPAAPAGNGFGKKLLDTLKAYWKAPKETAAAVAEDAKGMTTAGVFAGVHIRRLFSAASGCSGTCSAVRSAAGSKCEYHG